MNKLFKWSMNWIIVLWALVSLLYVKLSPHLMWYTDKSLHASLNVLVQGTLAIGPSALMLLISMTVKDWYRPRLSQLVKLWVVTVIIGLVSTLGVGMLQGIDIHNQIFPATLPIIRNTVPWMTGLFLGSLATNWLDDLTYQSQQQLIIWISVILVLSGLTQPSIWGWNNQISGLFYAFVFILGYLTRYLKISKSLLSKSLIGVGVINILLQLWSPQFSLDISTFDRFSQVTSPLNVLVAWFIVKILVKRRVALSKMQSWQAVLTIGCLSQPAVQTYLSTFNQHQTYFVFGETLVISVVGLIVSGLIYWGWKWTQHLNKISKIDRVDKLNKEDYQRLFHKLWPGILQVGMAYALTVLSMLLANSVDESNYYNNYGLFDLQQVMIWLNTLIIISLCWLLYFLTKRFWLSFILVLDLGIITVISNSLKIAARREPILPADLKMITAGKDLLSLVDGRIVALAIIGVILSVILAVYLDRKFPRPLGLRRFNCWRVIIFPLIIVSAFTWNTEGTFGNTVMKSLGNNPRFFKQLEGLEMNGPVVQFLNNVDVKVMDKPHGYSKTEMEKIITKYKKQAQLINRQRPNKISNQIVIFNLSESFANPQMVPGVKLKQNPIPYITELSQQTTAGKMISSGYGGGTANMEYMTLTGFNLSNFSPTLPTPYTQLVTKLKFNPAFIQSFPASISIHPYVGTYYSRIAVYKKLGFDKFLYVGSKYKINHKNYLEHNNYLSDKTAYANVLDEVKGSSTGKFINLVTMQNHMPYNDKYKLLSQYRVLKATPGTDVTALENFTTGIHYTDQAVKKFIHQLDQIQQPITVVFYGDHLPGIYGNNIKKDGVKLHETNYFIYSNQYARNHGAKTLTDKTAFVGPDNFIAMVMKQTGSKVNWQQALLTKVYEELPVATLNMTGVGGNRQLVDQRGRVIKFKTLNRQQKQLWHDYQLLQYDITAGKQYVKTALK